MSIFSNRVYRGKWVETDRHEITSEDLEGYKSVSLVPSEYGMSICLCLKSGGYEYTPLSNRSKTMSGDITLDDLKGATLVTLSRDGDDDIKRIEF